MLQTEENNLSLTFYLTAQIDPRTRDGMADSDSNISKIRTDSTLYLYKPVDDEPEETKLNTINLTGQRVSIKGDLLTKSMHVKVGGVGGVGS